jgi:hypothetical protein
MDADMDLEGERESKASLYRIFLGATDRVIKYLPEHEDPAMAMATRSWGRKAQAPP